MARTAWLLLTILSASYVCEGYKILVIFPMPGKSHNILGNGVVKLLLDAGHEVTFITSILNKKPHQNLTEIDVTRNWDLIPHDLLNIKNVMNGNIDMTDQWMMFILFNFLATETLNNPNVQQMLSDHNQKFDLIIAEWMYNELYSGLASVFEAPLIWFSTVEPHGLILNLVDDYVSTAYNGFYVDSIPPFTFGERVSELWSTVKTVLFRETVVRAMQLWYYRQIIAPHIESRGRIPPSFEELKYNASLVLGNSHVSLGQATRLPEIYKAVGGYHINDEVEPLTEDLKQIMENARDGVIYFSMGSNLKSKDLPDELKQDILNVFGSLKQTVLWKFEEELPNMPNNVHILKWAPQQSILAHPNCVLFITHGGLLSTTETIHIGVPIIGIPVFADQFTNVNRAVKKGFAKRVNLSYSMGKHLKEAIDDILTDPKYTEKVKQLSMIYHDRPVKPGVQLVHWVEHVVNTKGAPHLRSPALDVPWYQKAYLDLALVLATLIYLLRKLLKLILPVVFPSRYIVKEKHN